MSPTRQQRHQRRQLSRRDLALWLACCGLTSGMALALSWSLLQPALTDKVSEGLTRRARWYNFAITHAGARGLQQLDPNLRIQLGSLAPQALAPVRLRGDTPWKNESTTRLARALRQSGEIQAISEHVEGVSAANAGYWLQLASPDAVGGSVWVFANDRPHDTTEWRLWIVISAAAGVLAGTLIYLRWQLIKPLQTVLQQLPSTSTREMPLVDEEGGALARGVAMELNRFLECLNSSHDAQRLLLRGLTHDIRGPLGRLKLRCEQLSDGVVSLGELQEEIEEMNGDLDQLCELSGKIYAYADSLADQQEARELQLSDLLAQVVASYNNDAIQLDCCRQVVRLPATALKRCLNNLIDNALEYGRPPVRVNAVMRRQLLVISVEDHGSGLRSTNQLLLPRMPAADDRQENSHRGLGLGIVEQFCRSQGGSMTVTRSRALGGLRVELLLPQSQA